MLQNKTLGAAVSLICLLSLAGCRREQTVQNENPNYNPETGEVNANFIFNVSLNSSGETKMTADNTQANVTTADKFRGIENTYIIGFSQAQDGKPVTDANLVPDKFYDLARILNAGTIGGPVEGEDGQRTSNRVVELSIPIGINSFLFYGKAIKKTESGDEKKHTWDNAQGKIDFAVGNTSGNVYFKLRPRKEDFIRDYSTNVYEEVEKLISTVLTRIYNNGFNGSTTYNRVEKRVSFDTIVDQYPVVDWKSYATYDNTTKRWSLASTSPVGDQQEMTPLEEILGNAFVAFANVNEGEIRAGSGQSVARMVGDLAVAVGKVANAVPTSYAEAVAQAMAQRVLTRFANYFYVGVIGTTGEGNFSGVIGSGEECRWLKTSDVIYDLVINALNPTTNERLFTEDEFSEVRPHDDALNYFPAEFGLPMGVAQLQVVTDEGGLITASYATAIQGITSGSEQTGSMDKFTYPAELCYFGNSPIRVNSNSVDRNDYPNGVANWSDNSKWGSGWSERGAHVTSSTSSVAMADNINYGTALMQTTVSYVDGLTALKDNNHAVQKILNPSLGDAEEPDNEFVPAAGSLRVVGILIGGQYDKMGWNFVKASDSGINYVVYDRLADQALEDANGKNPLAGAIDVPVPGAVSAKNYTLVWDNFNGNPDAAQDEVPVAIEFYNELGDFYGEKNMVRKGSYFYIVGKLNPTAAKEGSTIAWPTAEEHFALPPYDADGNTIQKARVFIQDYNTIVNFKLDENSLKHAYVTMPDLRSAQMSLGLSVDLEWRRGLEFEPVL